MDNPQPTTETLTTSISVEITAEARRYIALSPAELRIRGVYNHVTMSGVACLGVFVSLFSVLLVPSECVPHRVGYSVATVVAGVGAVLCFGYAFWGTRREEKSRLGG